MYGGLYPPDHFILHVGTNDLSSKKSSMEIAESIINMACQLKNEIHDVSVSTIILRTDDKNWNENGMTVNLCLKELSKEKNIFLMHNSRKVKAQHLNHSSTPHPPRPFYKGKEGEGLTSSNLAIRVGMKYIL